MATTTLMSFAEFERLDFGADQLELLKGELIRLPPPYAQHMEIVGRLYKALSEVVDRLRAQSAPLGSTFVEMGYKFGNPTSWLRPDVSINHPAQACENFYLGAPLIAFEIASAFDRPDDLQDKIAEYLANGSQEVWVIYPKVRYALVYGQSDAVRKESQAIRSELLPGVAIPFDAIL